MAKHPDFRVLETQPFNGGFPQHFAAGELITPNECFFVRNHGEVPPISPAEYRLTVDGLVEQPLSLSLADLQQHPRVTQVVTLQCAGNRRRELETVAPIPGELIWDTEAVSTAEWQGIPLTAVLGMAGVKPEAKHIAFLGLDKVDEMGASSGFGGSIPLHAAPAVLLADQMNGVPLPPEHGFPVRTIVPGYIGARSVKWLVCITLQSEPSHNYFQRHAYRHFPASVTAETVDWSSGIMLGDLPVNSNFWLPHTGAQFLAAQPFEVSGHAITGSGRTIERVEVSCDGGKSWQEAQLTTEAQPGAWRLWRARLRMPAGQYTLACRAWDSSASTQPERLESVYNFKGYMNNAYHRVTIEVL
jgi:sulfite oxidase